MKIILEAKFSVVYQGIVMMESKETWKFVFQDFQGSGIEVKECDLGLTRSGGSDLHFFTLE